MKQLVVDLFNNKYETDLLASDMVMDNVREAPPGSPRNTLVNITSVPGSERAFFEVEFGYGRIPMTLIAQEHPTLNIPPKFGTLHDAIFHLRQVWNIPTLNPQDIFDMVLPLGPDNITIMAMVDSFGLIGGANFELTRDPESEN